jgi:hypothetical protein
MLYGNITDISVLEYQIIVGTIIAHSIIVFMIS